jgi:hypothetical protein
VYLDPELKARDRQPTGDWFHRCLETCCGTMRQARDRTLKRARGLGHSSWH